MLTLNGTQSTNNQVNWMIRLYAQGSNLVTLGDFSASTGWTLSGDWAIGSGVASYNYVDDAVGIIYRDITAVTATSYILEYEVTNTDTTAGVYTFVLLGGGDYIVSDNIALDFSLGKHSISIKCVATKTRLGLQLGGAAATTELSIDNVTLRLAEITTYIATEDIELDSTFDGKVLSNNGPISPMVWNSTIPGSGGTGSVTSYSINIARYIVNSNLDGFFNEFYPSTGSGVLIGKVIDIGFCSKDTATADADITWLLRGRIIEYSFGPRDMNIIVFQQSSLTNKEIPHYSVQKDFDNDVSYFAAAPADSYGLPIPIVYGDFTIGTASDDFRRYTGYTILSPAIPIYKRRTGYIVCTHKAYKTANDLLAIDCIYKYIDSLQSYLRIANANLLGSDTTNDNIKHSTNLVDRGYSTLLGVLVIRLIEPSVINDVDNFDNAIDQDDTTYSELDAVGGGDNTLALRPIAGATTSEIGYLGIANTDINVNFAISTDGGGNRNYKIDYYNSTVATPGGATTPATGTLTLGTAAIKTLSFGTDSNNKQDATFPWPIEEVTALDYQVDNTQTTVGEKIYVYYAYLELSNIKVYSVVYSGHAIRNSGNGRGL